MRLLVGILAILIIGLVLSLTLTSKVTKETETIEIGNIAILTDIGANWGNAAKNGIDLAIEDINSEGGINGRYLKANHQDYSFDVKKAVTALNYLTEVKEIDIIIGPTWTPEALAIKDIAREKKVLMISPSVGVKEFNEESKYLFTTWIHDSIISERLAEKVYERGHRKVVIIGAQQAWIVEQTNTFKRRFEEIGGKVIEVIEPLVESKDVSSEALKVKEATEADAIIYTGCAAPSSALIAKRVKEMGIELPLYSLTPDMDVIKASQGAFEGMLFLSSITPNPKFEERYEKRFGLKVDAGADTAYDAVMLIAMAIEETKSTDTTVLANYLNTIEFYNGVSGNLLSDRKGSFTKEFVAKTVVNEKIVEGKF